MIPHARAVHIARRFGLPDRPPPRPRLPVAPAPALVRAPFWWALAIVALAAVVVFFAGCSESLTEQIHRECREAARIYKDNGGGSSHFESDCRRSRATAVAYPRTR